MKMTSERRNQRFRAGDSMDLARLKIRENP